MTFRSLLVVLILPLTLQAQGNSTGSAHLKFAGTARSAAMGQSLVADPGVFSSVAINPANLFSDGSIELLLSHTQWIQDVNTEFIGARIPASFGTLNFSIVNTNVGGIELRDRPGPPIATFDARSAVFQVSLSRSMTDVITVGGTAKYLYEKIYIDEATGFAGDLGILYKTPIDGLTAGVALANLGSLQKFRDEASDLPSELRAGGTYRLALDNISFAFAGDIASELHISQNHLQIGGEAEYDHRFALRLGYQTGYESRGLSGGLGIRYDLLKLDYAYLPFSLALGDAHIVTLGFQF